MGAHLHAAFAGATFSTFATAAAMAAPKGSSSESALRWALEDTDLGCALTHPTSSCFTGPPLAPLPAWWEPSLRRAAGGAAGGGRRAAGDAHRPCRTHNTHGHAHRIRRPLLLNSSMRLRTTLSGGRRHTRRARRSQWRGRAVRHLGGWNVLQAVRLAKSRVELDSSEVPDCAYVAVVEASTKWRVCLGHLTLAFPRVLRSRVVSIPVLGTI